MERSLEALGNEKNQIKNIIEKSTKAKLKFEHIKFDKFEHIKFDYSKCILCLIV